MFNIKFNCSIIIVIPFLFSSCKTGKLEVLADLPNSLKETSAIETVNGSDLFWVIEDAGNKNNLYGLNDKGKIIKDIDIDNVQNIDWEDLTSDKDGNIYIGDFGNNSKTRKNFAIYKVNSSSQAGDEADAEVITFQLPKEDKSLDFESFFLYENQFYIFSKSDKKCILFNVPNVIGNHIAIRNSEIKFEGKHTKVTSADISDDGTIIVLLNHDKLWKLSNFNLNNIFGGTTEAITFDHDSQKEGINLLDKHTVLITDEKDKSEGGNLYKFTF